jgi:hypothetical protein
VVNTQHPHWNVQHKEAYFRESSKDQNRRWMPETMDVYIELGGYHLFIQGTPNYFCRISSQFISDEDASNVSRITFDYVGTQEDLQIIFDNVEHRIRSLWDQEIKNVLHRNYYFKNANHGQMEREFTYKKYIGLDAYHFISTYRSRDYNDAPSDEELLYITTKVKVMVCPCFFGPCIAMIYRRSMTNNKTLPDVEIFSMEQLHNVLHMLHENPEIVITK